MPPALRRVRVWDLPTRLFHWSLAACVLATVACAKVGGNAMAWHFRLGYAILALLAFRILWGFLGGHWSRFRRFIYSPAALLRYLKGAEREGDFLAVGHTPTGALSVFALIAVLLVQVATGLVADDEIANTGPLIKYVSGATSSLATSWHKSWGQWLVLGLVLLHVAAVVAYLARRQNLVAAMLSGDKLLPEGVPASRDGAGSRGLAAVLFAACAGGVAWLVSLGA